MRVAADMDWSSQQDDLARFIFSWLGYRRHSDVISERKVSHAL